MEEMNWEDEMTAEVLADRYGIEAETVEQVPMGTDTVNWRVVTSSGQRLFAKEYPATADLEAARAAWDMSEFCRAARLPVPRVWPDRDGNLLSLADGSPWAVIEEAPGKVATSAMTVALAEHTGMILGRMHRILAAYPLPRRHQHVRWRTGSVEDALAKCDTVLDTARRWQADNLDQLQGQIAQRREDLHTQVGRLRAHLPEDLVEQALHADFSRTNLLVQAGVVTGVIDFRAARAVPAWELGRAACDPRTLANSDQWADCVLAMAAAYRSENPTLPVAEVHNCARIALLYMLFSFYGATTAEYDLPDEADADLQRYWSERQRSIRLLIENLADLENALAAGTGRPRGTS
ncbi:phosphotransferase [Streptomyces sp. NBC_01551]|uniref:phosphotransferase enzyme family protein n=1 Tax=Streptomyces sp. NBC_01551 TaxID=2975876 RepID=UPI0022517411|nr:phosphotransferase [Streptomyces sp. NBC_01551]MCX4529292.1 phosphotransferase [Streptomyces sp. NBC_01551]